MNRWAFLAIIILLGSSSHAQRRGSQEMGGGLSFWSVSEKDSSESNFNLDALWAVYFSRDFMFEMEPHVTLRFNPEKLVLSGLFTGSLSKRLIDVSNMDRKSSVGMQRQYERSTAGIYASVGGGLWAERSTDPDDEKIFVGPALAAGIGTHSALGSFTNVRTKFQIAYLLPAPPLHDEPRTMFTVTIGFGVITRL
ncbi:hypothetical protein JW998_10060 [candidate division KSB1 bacterium]|nr:hypothetical protein [candidate division KSB1 bacterium]